MGLVASWLWRENPSKLSSAVCLGKETMEMNQHVMPTYGRLPVSFVKGDGAYLEDTAGNKYLDALTGIAVCGLGHAHPEISQVISDQSQKLLHTSNLYDIPIQAKLAERLCKLSGMDNVFFCNSGAEANEAAIKIARLYGNQNSVKNPLILVAENSFHGRTMATLTATGSRKVQAGFEPLVSGFIRTPYNDIDAIKRIAQENQNIVAVLLEPILGEGGIEIPSDDYLPALRTTCDENDWLMMLDEVQTGNGRTGEFFAYQHFNIAPDIVTTAKGLGNGFPIGACMARGVAASVFQPGNHGSTFGGNPLACAAANAVLDIIEKDSICDHARKTGHLLVELMKAKLGGINRVKEIRGRGMMIAVELVDEAPDLVRKALAERLLINVTQGNIIRLLPPLNLAQSEAEELVNKLAKILLLTT